MRLLYKDDGMCGIMGSVLGELMGYIFEGWNLMGVYFFYFFLFWGMFLVTKCLMGHIFDRKLLFMGMIS